MKDIKIYTTSWCGYCTAAKRALRDAGLAFEEISVENDPELRARISRENGNYATVPMIFIDGKFIGGYTDLVPILAKRRSA